MIQEPYQTDFRVPTLQEQDQDCPGLHAVCGKASFPGADVNEHCVSHVYQSVWYQCPLSFGWGEGFLSEKTKSQSAAWFGVGRLGLRQMPERLVYNDSLSCIRLSFASFLSGLERLDLDIWRGVVFR